MLDCIVKGPLVFGVRVIEECSQIDQQLSSLNVTFTYGVIDRSLAILVLSVDILMLLIYDKVDDLVVAVATSVEQGRLLERVSKERVAADVGQSLNHLEALVVVGHNACREDRILTEVFRLVDQLPHINVLLSYHIEYLINFSFLDFVKDGLVKWVQRARLRLGRVKLILRGLFGCRLLCR